MALGWVLTEGLAVDPDSGEVLDLTIRSFGILRARSTPPIDVTVLDDPGPPCPRRGDAVFAAVAAATWEALTDAEGERPDMLPGPCGPPRPGPPARDPTAALRGSVALCPVRSCSSWRWCSSSRSA